MIQSTNKLVHNLHSFVKQKKFICTAAALAAALFCIGCGSSSETKATTMYLTKTQGTVDVANDKGKSIDVVEPLGLYSGYGLDTDAESYAWINLDNVKLTKMDEQSEIEIRKLGKALDIDVKSGSLFFHVTEPLGEDETMNIRTSTTMVGIRGTCGWVEVDEHDHLRLYMLEGTVQYTYEDPDTENRQEVQVSAGETAELAAADDGTYELKVDFASSMEIPEFIKEEITDSDIMAYMEEMGIAISYGRHDDEDGSSEPEKTPSATPEPENTEVALNMPVTADEISSQLWARNTQTVTVKSDGQESTLDINFLNIPEGKTLILEDGININLVYPEDFDEKSSNLYIRGNMVINGNLTTDEGELNLDGGTLQINGSVTLGAQSWVIMASNIDPDKSPRLTVTEGIYNYGTIDLYRGTIEADITVYVGGTLHQQGEVIGEVITGETPADGGR